MPDYMEKVPFCQEIFRESSCIKGRNHIKLIVTQFAGAEKKKNYVVYCGIEGMHGLRGHAQDGGNMKKLLNDGWEFVKR